MEPHSGYIEKSVIIHRAESGFGFKVSGQNPVFVEHVYENGEAWKAGVRKNDRIIKVNGTLVKSYEHSSVVNMIKNCAPFVNLTLQRSTETFPVSHNSSQPCEANNGTFSASNSNLSSSSIKTHLPHPRLPTDNLNWLLDIGDDLFQDYQPINDSTQGAPQSTGVSQLIEEGSSLNTSNQSTFTSAVRPKIRQNKNQSTRDNPYYYYKSATERNSDVTNSNSANSSPSSQDPDSSKGSMSIVRSRSSGKMSTRSSSAKYKTRKLRSRLVSDFRSLTIANIQNTPSSLSTSPSSSDLSDCDDSDSIQQDLLSFKTPNSSIIGNTTIVTNSTNTPGTSQTISQNSPKLKHTTHRLEIIRELIDTEKTHTERLKHLNDLLYRPIKAEGLVPMDQLKMIFSCHKTLFKIHRKIYKLLVAAQQNVDEYHQEPLIGRALVEIFEGELGKRLEKAASSFCACQSINAELLNRITRKDTKVGEFLAQVANQQMLGRLGIKDLLASCFQRLTKYPLLLDNLLKATPTRPIGIHSKSLSDGSIALTGMNTNHDTESYSSTNNNTDESKLMLKTSAHLNSVDDNLEAQAATNSLFPTLEDEYTYERSCIKRALKQSRNILTHVNEAVKTAISHNRLRDLWKKTDKMQSLPHIDIDTQQILHEGPLTLRLSKKSFDVYVLLLTDYLVILTKEGQEKYKLKNFTSDGRPAKQFSPIFNIDKHLATRDTAIDENGFYLLCNLEKSERFYEFASRSPDERAKWKEKIHAAQQFHYSVVPDNDDTLTRYRELITLTNSNNTPNNVDL